MSLICKFVSTFEWFLSQEFRHQYNLKYTMNIEFCFHLLCTSNDCGLRTLEETVRVTNRLIVFTCPALSNSSWLVITEFNAEGINSPLIFISSNFSSRIAIFVAKMSFFFRSTLNLSPNKYTTEKIFNFELQIQKYLNNN